MKQKRNLKSLIIVTVLALLLIVPFIALEMLNNVLTNGRSSRSWLENKFGTELSRVYPTQNVEDLFKEFPDGFGIEQTHTDGKYRIKMELSGDGETRQISGVLKQTLRKTDADEVVIRVDYQNGSFIFSDEAKAKTFWPYDGFLFQHLSIDKSFLSSQKLEDKHYNFQNGSFGLRYELNTSIISNYLEISNKNDYILEFGGSNSNRGYYYSVSVEDSNNINNFNFSERIFDTNN
ncbi:hypothetical protein AALH12_03130 [Streptococcus ferus]|uniref:hypothetical protein n=1 Tax=Streptococcus ferus TaxID=1345 RepID=UPI003518D4F1